ncbi:MAG: TetR/AcrR family transcriptional regulator [Gemmatimonadales bacterium]|jgi:AcrR family transcriptional regulator
MTDTRNIILNTAERLFAQHGIQGVSVRRILSEARLNLALAHYHFGSRAKLIEEVLRRRIIPMHEERLVLLDEVESSAEAPSLENVLRAYLSPALRLIYEHPQFARLLGYLHAIRDEHLRPFEVRVPAQLEEDGAVAVPAKKLVEIDDPVLTEVSRRFTDAARRALPPHVSDLTLLWRAHFVGGVLTQTLTGYGDLERLADQADEARNMEQVLEEMVAFCAAGLRAPQPDQELEAPR